MNEASEIPEPPAVIPRRPLWLTLVIPPLVTVLATSILPFCGLEQNDTAGMMVLIPSFVSLGLVPGLAFHFHDAVRHRYRGKSLGFLVFSYLIGQVILCVSLSVGSCFLVYAHLNNS